MLSFFFLLTFPTKTLPYETMKGKSGRFNQISYQNEYIKEKYDRINLTVPKGRKEEIKKKAASTGQSVNEYINTFIDKDK